MIIITTLDGREVAALRDRNCIVTARQIRDVERRSAIPAGDSILALGRYRWTTGGYRVVPEPHTHDTYFIRPMRMDDAGRLGGQTRTPARAAASRANGAKGGRPKKKLSPNPLGGAA